MGDLPRMNDSQLRRTRKLIRQLCCNYDKGNCIILDDACPQVNTYSILCRHFRQAVLPNDCQLQQEISRRTGGWKSCASCGKLFHPGSNRALYCPGCAKEIERRRIRERVRRHRSGM